MTRSLHLRSGGIAATLAATVVIATAAVSPAAAADTGTLTDLGPASLSSSIVTGVLNGDKAFVVSRAITPANLGVLDRTTGKVTTTALPGSQGAWSSAVIGSDTYVATYLPAVVYRVGADGSSTKISAPSGPQLFYDMTTTPDGQLVAGGYPDGAVYVIDPKTGATENWGRASAGEQYVRSLAADDTTIYAGVGSHAHLVAFDRATRTKTEILPPELASESFVYELAISDKYVIAGMNPSGRVAIIDKADPSDYRIVTPVQTVGGGIDAMTVGGTADDPVVYGTARPQGTLFSIDLNSGATTNLGTPVPGEETREVYTEGDTVVGFSGSGVMWTRHLDTGAVDVLDLQAAGLTPGPEIPLSLAANKHDVMVGGNLGVQIHHLDDGTTSRVWVNGEPKAQVLAGNTDYLAMYPSGSLQALNIQSGAVTTLSTFGEDQIRPRDMVRGNGLLLIGTQPEYGELGGALVIYDQDAKTTQVYRDVVPHQSVASVASDGHTAYLGSETAGGIGAVPTEKQAVVSFFDLATRAVTRTVVPVRGTQQITDLVIAGDRLVGITDTGVLFELDRGTGAVLRTLKASTTGGQLQAGDGWLTLTDGHQVLRIDTTTWALTTLASGLAGQAQGVLGHQHADLFTTRGNNLIQLPL